MLDFNKELEKIFGGASSDINKLAEENRKRTEANLNRFAKEMEESRRRLHELATPTISGYEPIVAHIKASQNYQNMLRKGGKFVVEHYIGDGMMIAVHEDGSYEIAPKPIPCNW